MSSTVNAQYPASHAIDNDPSTLTATGSGIGNWLSVELASDTRVGEVAVVNRNDNADLAAWLGDFEVWVGGSAGGTTPPTATKCGEASYDAQVNARPYVISCGGNRLARFVTIKQVGAPARYLTLAQVEVYVAQIGPSPPPSLLPASPSPPTSSSLSPSPSPPPVPLANPSPPTSPSLPTPSPVAATLESAAMKTVYGVGEWPPENCIDHDTSSAPSSLCASKNRNNNWISVKVAGSVTIGEVAVWNRDDNAEFAEWLGDFEVWIGDSTGGFTPPSATKCGEASYNAQTNARPYIISCAHVTSSGRYVTIRQVGLKRFLSLAEVQVFLA